MLVARNRMFALQELALRAEHKICRLVIGREANLAMTTRIDGARKVLALVVTAIALVGVAEADEYYKDENGVLHLLQRPAVSRDARERERERYQEEAQAQQEKTRRHEEQVQLEQTEALVRQQEAAQRQEQAAQRQEEAAAAQHWVMVRLITVLCLIGGGWVAGALAVGRTAMKKGRSYGGFFVLTLLLSPLLMGLIVSCMRSEPKRESLPST
jgi:cobalamin biosynthesis Mg chelatase CobN